MTSMLTNLSIIQKLAGDLVRAKHLNYSQQCIPYYVEEANFTIENIDDLRNPSGFLLKSTLIRHRICVSGQHSEPIPHSQADLAVNSKCIVYLHGLGSSRLEALPLVESLPREYCLFAFDFAGSGKSEGDNITYGLRESEDILPILEYLRINRGIKEFVIWGRSMGAVAALLFAINLGERSKQCVSAAAMVSRVMGLVVDSPFCDFREITKQIGLKRVKVPEFLIHIALDIVKHSFEQILKDPRRDGKVYNPFAIQLDQQPIQTRIPTIFLYSSKDEVVPKEHSQKIIQAFKSQYEKIIMQDCTHNQSRPKPYIERIFQSLQRSQHKVKARATVLDQSRGNVLCRNRSMDLDSSKGTGSRRGISVQSKEKRQVYLMDDVKTCEQLPMHSKISVSTYSSLKTEPRKDHPQAKYSMATENNIRPGSPLKIKVPGRRTSTGALQARQPLQKPASFYNQLEYDTQIMFKKLQMDTPGDPSPNQAHVPRSMPSHSKLRRQARKVQPQLSHTRYL